MKDVESILTGFVANINDQNYIDKAVYFIANKDTFVDAVEKVEVCATFIKNKQTNAESWKNFVKEVNDDLAKAAKNVQVIATATAEFDVAFCLGIMNKYSELQKLYQQIRDEYFKKYSEAASSMTEKYKTLKDKAIALIQEIDALDFTENAIAKSKANSILQFAEGRICETPKITTSIKEYNTKLTYSEVLSANEMFAQKETEINIVDAQLVREKAEEPVVPAPVADDTPTEDIPQPQVVVNTIKRTLPNADITVAEYKSWLLSEIKTMSAMKDTDKVTF